MPQIAPCFLCNRNFPSPENNSASKLPRTQIQTVAILVHVHQFVTDPCYPRNHLTLPLSTNVALWFSAELTFLNQPCCFWQSIQELAPSLGDEWIIMVKIFKFLKKYRMRIPTEEIKDPLVEIADIYHKCISQDIKSYCECLKAGNDISEVMLIRDTNTWGNYPPDSLEFVALHPCLLKYKVTNYYSAAMESN